MLPSHLFFPVIIVNQVDHQTYKRYNYNNGTPEYLQWHRHILSFNDGYKQEDGYDHPYQHQQQVNKEHTRKIIHVLAD
jgi:hypothetical protein